MDAVIAGFTDQVDSFALILPLGLVSEYNKKFNEGYRNEYQYAYIKVSNHAALLRVSSRIQGMGLVVEAEKGVSRQILSLKETIDLIIRLLQSIIVIIAVIAISFATMIAVLNRIEYYRTMRLVGASRAFLTTAILAKYLLIGFAGAWGGASLLRYASVRVTEYFHLTGFMISVSLPDEMFRIFLLSGMLIPVLSALPALVRLYVKGLSGD
jgi:cell division protein FtsX